VVEDQGRDIAGMGVAVADKAAALGRFVDNSFEDPEVLLRPAEREHWLRHDPLTVALRGETQ